MRVTEKQLRKMIREELGRNLRTIDNDPYTWEDYEDVQVETWHDTSQDKHFVKVDCISDPNLSIPEKSFPDEHTASHWARMQADQIMRKTLDKIN